MLCFGHCRVEFAVQVREPLNRALMALGIRLKRPINERPTVPRIIAS